VFNVRSITLCAVAIVKSSPQTELAINTHVTVVNTHTLVSDVHHDVANTHTIAANTHTIVSEIHRSVLNREEGIDDKNRTVSDTRALYITKQILTTPQAQNRSAI